MKSFYITPFIRTIANVMFNTEKEATDFVAKSKTDNHFVSVNYQGAVTGFYIVSVIHEECADKDFLVTLADEDLIDDLNNYLNNAYKELDITFGNNWEIYDEIPLVDCYVECNECGKGFRIEFTEDKFKEFIERNVSEDSKYELDFEFNFLCNNCYDYFNKQ